EAPPYVGEPGTAAHQAKGLVGALDQRTGKGDALRLIAVEKLGPRPALQHGGELPGEIHRITHAGIHALAAGRAMDMAGIAGDEGTAFAEMIGDTMMDAVVREPVDGLDLDTALALDIVADHLECEIGLGLEAIRHDADEPERARL